MTRSNKKTSNENDKTQTKKREKLIHQIVIIISQLKENHRRVSISSNRHSQSHWKLNKTTINEDKLFLLMKIFYVDTMSVDTQTSCEQ